MDVSQVYGQVAELFSDAPDLQVAFKNYLPNEAPTASRVETQTEGREPSSTSWAVPEHLQLTTASAEQETGNIRQTERNNSLTSDWVCGNCSAKNPYSADMRCLACTLKTEASDMDLVERIRNTTSADVGDRESSDAEPKSGSVDDRAFPMVAPIDDVVEDYDHTYITVHRRNEGMKPENVRWHNETAVDPRTRRSESSEMSDPAISDSHGIPSNITIAARGLEAKGKVSDSQNEPSKTVDEPKQARHFQTREDGTEEHLSDAFVGSQFEKDTLVEQQSHDWLEESASVMREQRALYGVKNNTIESHSRSETHNNTEPPALPDALQLEHPPTYSKIHKNFLDLETLRYYNLPYEYDVDPNYFIILKEMSQKETDVLFEHTRRLRARHSQKSQTHPSNDLLKEKLKPVSENPGASRDPTTASPFGVDQTPAKSSHDYEKFKHQTGLPPGSIAGLNAVYNPGFDFNSSGIDKMAMLGDASDPAGNSASGETQRYAEAEGDVEKNRLATVTNNAPVDNVLANFKEFAQKIRTDAESPADNPEATMIAEPEPVVEPEPSPPADEKPADDWDIWSAIFVSTNKSKKGKKGTAAAVPDSPKEEPVAEPGPAPEPEPEPEPEASKEEKNEGGDWGFSAIWGAGKKKKKKGKNASTSRNQLESTSAPNDRHGGDILKDTRAPAPASPEGTEVSHFH